MNKKSMFYLNNVKFIWILWPLKLLINDTSRNWLIAILRSWKNINFEIPDPIVCIREIKLWKQLFPWVITSQVCEYRTNKTTVNISKFISEIKYLKGPFMSPLTVWNVTLYLTIIYVFFVLKKGQN
jgi:hypothetical protein